MDFGGVQNENGVLTFCESCGFLKPLEALCPIVWLPYAVPRHNDGALTVAR